MKKVLSILLAILVIGACATTDANAKKRTKSKKTTTTATTSVNKDDFVKYWSEYGVMHPFQLEINYNSDNDTFSCTLYSQVEMCTGTGKLKGNTINFKCDNGFKITATLKGGTLKVRAKDRHKTYNCTMR